MGNFWSMCPEASIKVILAYLDHGIFVFWSLKRFGRFEAIASLDAYQIIHYQFLSKTHHFFVSWFSKNSRNKFLNQEFYGQFPEQAWSNGLFDFSKSCPSGHQGFQKIPKWKKVFVKIDWLLTMITNHFEIPVVQNLTTDRKSVV